ncbi:MAG: hypothetical protein SPLUMA2_SPLUMAMAG2_01598 [uncultured Sulfurimonas sp.]|nr:MAG: hypothetical protein SPLUMA2_SPLUMAMAG2_01598 [uncultured Sulfurimonas sp.]
MEEINSLLKKYKNFVGAQVRSIRTTSETSKVVTLVLQDDDGEDISSVNLEFININSSRTLPDSALAYMDMMSGIAIIYENERYAFTIGRATTMLAVHTTPVFIISDDIKIEDKGSD